MTKKNIDKIRIGDVVYDDPKDIAHVMNLTLKEDLQMNLNL